MLIERRASSFALPEALKNGGCRLIFHNWTPHHLASTDSRFRVSWLSIQTCLQHGPFIHQRTTSNCPAHNQPRGRLERRSFMADGSLSASELWFPCLRQSSRKLRNLPPSAVGNTITSNLLILEGAAARTRTVWRPTSAPRSSALPSALLRSESSCAPSTGNRYALEVAQPNQPADDRSYFDAAAEESPGYF